MWYQEFMKIFPRLPLHGYGYWPKFLFGDIGMHLTPTTPGLGQAPLRS